jgi:hypothetical protein
MITDEELLLYYYRDGLDPAERKRVGAALSEQPELARRLHRLIARLDEAASIPEVPVPAHIQQRWRTALESAAGGDASADSARAREPSPAKRFATRLWWAAAVAVVAIVAAIASLQFAEESQDRTAGTAATPTASGPGVADRNPAYERGLRYHLASTERQLASLEEATPESRARLIETIIAQNRMYALAAERAGEPQLARVLRAFGPVLESLAQEGGEPSSSSLARLDFEMRVIRARLNADAHEPIPARPPVL